MQNVRQLSTAVGIATLIVTAGAAALMAITFKINATPSDGHKEIIVAAATLLPISAATWWIFRKFKRSGFSPRETRAITIAYAATCPFWLALALVLGEIPGSIAEHFLGQRFVLPSVFVGVVALAAMLSFATCAFILWVTRRSDQLSAEKTLES